jgi:UrcA family protein
MDTRLPFPKPAFAILPMVALGALALGGALSAPAFADAPRPEVLAVSHAGLDLNQPADARVLIRRIEAAATTVCGPAPASSSLLPRAMHDYRDCVSGAVDRAVADLGAPLVVAIHTGRTPVSSNFASR